MRHTLRGGNLHLLQAPESRVYCAVNIAGVQPIALQTPQMAALLRRAVGGAPLSDGSTFQIPNTIFDTASPGIVLNSTIANVLGVGREQAGGGDALLTHNYVGGAIDLNVSESLDVSIAPNNPLIDPTDVTNYTQDSGQKFLEIGPVPDDPSLDLLSLIGPEATLGNVVVIDPKPADTFDDTMRTYVYDQGTPENTDPNTEEEDPGIPAVSNTVQLSYADDSSFMSITSGAANSASEHGLPFVGPNPFNPAGDSTPPVSFSLGADANTGSFLLDTAAATSMISLAKAASLGVTYAAGTFNTSSASLLGVPASQQFRLTVQSLAGPVTLAGLYLDTLTLQTGAGPIEFDHVPLLVGDVALSNPTTSATTTMDGVLGMNLFSAGASLDAHGTLQNQTPGSFNWIVYDEANKTLGLDVASLAAHPHVTAASFNYAGTTQSISFNVSSDVVQADSPLNEDLTLTNQITGQTYDFTNTTIDATYDPATEQVSFTFPSFPHGMLPDGNYTATLFSGAVLDDNGAGLGDDYTLAFWTSQGDANHDRAINAADFDALASNYGSHGRGFADGDFNYDGVVNAIDFNILAGRFNTFFSGPAAPEMLLAPGGALAVPTSQAAPAAPLASPLAALFAGSRVISVADLAGLKEPTSANP